MNYFVIAQIFGLISFVFGGLAMMTNKKRNVIHCNTVANFASSMQYACLGAFTGALSLIVIIIRNVTFSKYKSNKIPVIYLILVIIFAIITSIISYDGLISILPSLAVCIFSYGIWQHNIKKIKIINILVSIIGIIYDIHYMAYVTAFAQGTYIVIGLFSYFEYIKARRHRIIKRKKLF
jgi:hypothetical protein